MTGDLLQYHWRPPGPVSEAFMTSDAPVQILNGPVGSGKTTTVMVKIIKLAARQQPSTRERGPGGRPLRKFRATVVRSTYRDLWRTTLPSWWHLVPKSAGDWSGAENAPATHKIMFLHRDECIHLWMDFLAIGEHSVEDVMRGYENTVLVCNELDLLPAQDLFSFAEQRGGRYPKMDEGGPNWRGILCDCNAPLLTTWVEKNIFRPSAAELAAKGIALFRQPSGLAPNAENLMNLPGGRDYYTRGLARQSESYIRRMIRNEPGFNEAGKPIYPEFNDLQDVAPDHLAPIAHLPLVIGIDAGGSPAAVFCQRMGDGGWWVIDELVSGHGTGPTRFAEALAQRLHERFPECRAIQCWGDPAAQYGADRQAEEQSWLEVVAHVAKLRVDPAPTNDPRIRWDAVRRPLTTRRASGSGLLLSRRCEMLRAGFNGGYRFRKQVGSADQYTESAEKNEFSHVHDALQYALCGGGEDAAVRGRGEDWQRQMARHQVLADWDPLG